MDIRPMQAPDLPEVAGLFDAYRQFYGQPPDRKRAELFLAERFTKRESVVLVAAAPNQALIGFCQLYPGFCSVEATKIYTLYDLYVMPQARQAGAGRQLLLAAERLASAEGKSRLDLTTAKTNRVAQSLYQSQGWVKDDVFFAYSRRVEPHQPAR